MRTYFYIVWTDRVGSHVDGYEIHEFQGPLHVLLAREQAEKQWGKGGRLAQEVAPPES